MPRHVFRGTDLRVVKALPTAEAEPIRLLTIELYEDGVIVRWVLPNFVYPLSKGRPTYQTMEPLLLSLSDDLGTAYEFHSGGSAASDDGPLRGEAVFTPAVPADVRRLTITHRTGRATIALNE